MRKLFLFTISMLFMVPLALGQENFRAGYVITPGGDTIHGFINYRNWGVNPSKISFEKVLKGQRVFYRPRDIRAFYVQDEYYLSAVVKNETSARSQLDNVSDNAAIQTRTDTAFLRRLAKGHPALLFYKSPMNIENFYLMKNGKIHLLKYKKYMMQQSDGGSYVAENKEYVGQLLVFMADCPKMKSQISYSQYTRQSLVKLFGNYYQCLHETGAQTQKVEKTKLKWGLVAGIGGESVKFLGPYLSHYQFNAAASLTGGLVFDLVMPRNFKEWSLHNELAYSSFASTGVWGQYQMKFGFSSVALTDMARFSHSLGKISVFANAGVSNGIVINYTNQGTKPSDKAFPPDGLNKRFFALVGGIGLRHKNLSFELRAESKSQLSGYTSETIGTKQIGVMIGYTF